MKKSRAFQVISSMVIAYVIQNILIAVLGFPALSYDRVYISLVCILMMMSSMSRSSPSSGSGIMKEERIVDGQGRTGRIFEQARYPGIKVLEESSEGKTYITDQGEVVTTKYVTTSTGEVNNEDFVIGLSVIILLICIVTLVFSGIGSLLSHMFAEAQNNTSEFIETLAARQSDVSEENAVQGEDEAVFVDYGIFTDGHGITASEYVIEDSDARNLTDEDTDCLTLRGINYAKNELYARHGRKFESRELQDFFGSRDWYNGSREATPAEDDKIQSEFNSYENYNCDLLAKLEKSKGTYILD